MSNYPDIDDEDFQEKIAIKYKKYKIPNKRPSFKALCYPNSFNYQLPQVFVSQFINPKTPYKGILVFHKIGGGKTCLSILTGLQWYETRRVIFIVPASLIGNIYKEFRSECTGNKYISKAERNQLAKLHPASREHKEMVQMINDRVDEDFEIYSFHKYVNLVEKGKMKLKNALVIIDEVQNVVSENGLFYRTILRSFNESSRSARIVIMSGTPIFDKPIELALTINLLKPKVPLPTGKEFNNLFLQPINGGYALKNKELLSKLLQGYISFSPGAPKIAFPEQIIKMVKCPMSAFQYKSYKIVEKREGNPEFRDILKLSNAFFIGSRMMSNVAYPNKKINEKGMQSFEGKRLHLTHIGKYSTKFEKIINRSRNIHGASIVYSNFREYGGIEPLLKTLEHNGYIYVFDEDADKKKYNKKRFAIWSGKESMDEKETAKNIYNDINNIDGSMLKMIILSPSGKEGLSLLNTGSLHVMEPYFNYSRMAQIFGRAVRFCSHKALPADKRKVYIFIYIAVSPTGKKLIDGYIFDMMKEKKSLLSEFYDVLEDVAVDKHLFKNAKKHI
jgi:hypothetical protein